MVEIIPHILLISVLAGVMDARQARTHANIRESALVDSPCTFSMADPFNGRLDPGGKMSIDQWAATYFADAPKIKPNNDLQIGFACTKEESFEKVCAKIGVRFINGKWTLVPYFKSEKPGGHIVIKNLDKNNAKGVIYVSSDTTGSIQFRLRTLSFCLTSGNGWTLWGYSNVDYAPYNPRKSTEAEAIRLIKSIRFISPPASGVNPSSIPR